MEKCYRFRLYPTNEQQTLIEKTFGCTRKVYNYFLDKRKTEWETNRKSLSYIDCAQLLVDYKHDESYLKEVDSTLCKMHCVILMQRTKAFSKSVMVILNSRRNMIVIKPIAAQTMVTLLSSLKKQLSCRNLVSYHAEFPDKFKVALSMQP